MMIQVYVRLKVTIPTQIKTKNFMLSTQLISLFNYFDQLYDIYMSHCKLKYFIIFTERDKIKERGCWPQIRCKIIVMGATCIRSGQQYSSLFNLNLNFSVVLDYVIT